MATSNDPRFERLLEQASHAAFILDPIEDRFLAANPAGCTMLEYTLDELLATPVSQIHPGELPQLQDFVGGVMREGHGSTITLTCRTRSSCYLPTEMMLWAFSGGGDRVYVLALIRDRSEHRARRRGDSAATQRSHSRSCDARRSEAQRLGRSTHMVTTGLIVRLEAKAGKEEELARFLADALPLVEDEPETVAWLAIKAGTTSFAIVDVFPNEAGRQAHLEGAVAKALSEKANELLAEPPSVEHVDVLAAKLP